MFTNKSANCIAAGILGLMFLIMFFSAWNDSATMDELAHIPSGYSYLTQKDMRLNPEHPPLIKDLSALPLLFLDLNFPVNHTAFRDDINGQWTMGSVFLYESGNNPDQILHYARFPLMILAVLFGFLLFLWIRGKYGNKTGLLTLLFFALSPTFIAHSRYVTTDLGAAFGFFIGIASFVKYLENRDGQKKRKYLIIAGIAFGIAEVLKFSLFLLVPLYLIYGALWAFLSQFEKDSEFFSYSKFKLAKILFFKKSFFKEYGKILLETILIFLIGIFIIWLVYSYHIINYPKERQINDTAFILNSFGNRTFVDLTLKMAFIPIFRPLAEYLLGLLMVIQRAGGGNTTYFMGEIAVNGWWQYFPVAYLLKEQLIFHIFSLIAILIAVFAVVKSKNRSFNSVFEWMKLNFGLTAGIIFIALYWTQSITSNLNIGVRHVLPTFPFIYLLTAREITIWTNFVSFDNPMNIIARLRFIYVNYVKNSFKHFIVLSLFFLMFLSIIINFPNYLSYFNILAGGTENGYKYITDSNYDWGQDLKRLKFFTEEQKIDKIYVDYFGGGSPSYYLGDKFIGWNSEKGIPPSGSYFAVSATFRQGGTAEPTPGITIDKSRSYYWLKDKIPVDRAGMSIFIYKIN